MLLEVKTKNIIVKEVILDNRTINIYDFGEISKINRDGLNIKTSEVKFIPKTYTEQVLFKYGINEDKYKSITRYLEKEIKSIIY